MYTFAWSRSHRCRCKTPKHSARSACIAESRTSARRLAATVPPAPSPSLGAPALPWSATVGGRREGAGSPPRDVPEGVVQGVEEGRALLASVLLPPVVLGCAVGLATSSAAAAAAARIAGRLALPAPACGGVVARLGEELVDRALQLVEVRQPHLLDGCLLDLFKLGGLVLCHALELFLALLCQGRNLHDQQVLVSRPRWFLVSESLELQSRQIFDDISLLPIVDVKLLGDYQRNEPGAV
mmetsp:Transcript_96624/g.268612  ORF Transcript_96624/g.268612 Transcript_96624/m.268612 type:complete len:240 (-) Transcript_96624:3218-3937(-)